MKRARLFRIKSVVSLTNIIQPSIETKFSQLGIPLDIFNHNLVMVDETANCFWTWWNNFQLAIPKQFCIEV